ncbi:hypothetical protein [Falsirhodobacter sp. 1013]|uniref:hypothetical protein n=1 Tax=Falsirhodobacter sp. 1013 TaxID=3417566 RepID=UPI003EBBB54B
MNVAGQGVGPRLNPHQAGQVPVDHVWIFLVMNLIGRVRLQDHLVRALQKLHRNPEQLIKLFGVSGGEKCSSAGFHLASKPERMSMSDV